MSRGFAAGLSLALFTLLFAACSTSPKRAALPASLDELAKQSLARLDGELSVPGLKEPVEIIRDQQGIPHIYAKNDDDMFFAQGYVMAQDRLWQLEMWRRWREGRLAEIFGPKAYDYDARTRLLMFRGPWDEKEWTSYHPDAERFSLRGPTASTRSWPNTPTTCLWSSSSRASSPSPGPRAP